MYFRTRTFIVPISRFMRYTLLKHIYLSICQLLLFLLRWWLSVHPVKRTNAMPTFNPNLFHWASRCLLWFDSTLLCLMMVSLFCIPLSLFFNSSKTSFVKQVHYAVFASHILCLIHCRHQFLCFINVTYRFSAIHPNVLACKYFPLVSFL